MSEAKLCRCHACRALFRVREAGDCSATARRALSRRRLTRIFARLSCLLFRILRTAHVLTCGRLSARRFARIRRLIRTAIRARLMRRRLFYRLRLCRRSESDRRVIARGRQLRAVDGNVRRRRFGRRSAHYEHDRRVVFKLPDVAEHLRRALISVRGVFLHRAENYLFESERHLRIYLRRRHGLFVYFASKRRRPEFPL